jgi:hypothetical protein
MLQVGATQEQEAAAAAAVVVVVVHLSPLSIPQITESNGAPG